MLLVVQLVAGIFITYKDINLPFSKAYSAKELLSKVPPNTALVTDYWALTALVGYTDKPYYCVDLQQEASFILWGGDMVHMGENTNRYYNGVNRFMQQHGLKEVYMVSTSNTAVLYDIDPKLFTDLSVELVEKRTGAIEKWSNLYLYRIHIP